MSDIDEIRQIVADVERGFNAGDATLMNKHVAPDAALVGATGVRLVGIDEVMAASEALLAGPFRDQYARYVVRDVRFVRPDVALAYKEAYAVTADGEPIDLDHAMCALYVLVKEDGRWLITARQNTLVPK
ncbi:MAG: SgcJ/EcaC family oxidoreductase [Actinophytocola sp.]|uniref:SgcJ/EcaC family oxidoreductase n=1 Tax=Actinophytocola sp. TaxID=1872138 RepID=UPI003C715422